MNGLVSWDPRGYNTSPMTVENSGSLPPASAFVGGGVPGVATVGVGGQVQTGRTALMILAVLVIGVAAFDVWTREFQK